MSRRILLYVHYNKYDKLADYVLYQLGKLRPLYERVVFISNSALPEDATERLGNNVDKIVQRENAGFDFAAWRDGMLEEGWEALEQYDWLTIMNDTCFGPVYPFGSIYEKMENSSTDFWGMTDYLEGKIKARVATKGVINYHLMSYFISFSRKVVKSLTFHNFWESVIAYDDVVEVIKNYETQLTKLLQNAGFRSEAFLSSNSLDKVKYKIMDNNLTIFHPNICLKEGMPFAKVKAFTDLNASSDLVNYELLDIVRSAGYNTQYISDHLLSQMTVQTTPDRLYLIESSVMKFDCVPTIELGNAISRKKIAVHIHAFYPDVLKVMLDKFEDGTIVLDYYITVPSNDAAEEVKQIFEEKSIDTGNVIVVENRGRDILPWLHIQDELKKYDIVGHFHTKKSKEANEIIGKIWSEDILNALVLQKHQIFGEFAKNANIGVIIPDIPTNFHYFNQATSIRDKKIFNLADSFWTKIDGNKTIKFARKSSLVFPYGTMFWYQPAALKKLTDYKFGGGEISSEPLPQNSILHAIERMIVYVACDAGYTYRIAPTKYVSGFVDNATYSAIIQNLSRKYSWQRIDGRVLRKLARFKAFSWLLPVYRRLKNTRR